MPHLPRTLPGMIKIGDLVRDCDGEVGLVVDVEMYFELMEVHPPLDKNEVITVNLITVYCFRERCDMIFFDNELEVIHPA